MNRRTHLFLLSTAACVISVTWLCAQSTPTAESPNEGSTLTYDETNEIWRFQWWGRDGRTYFLQHSEDLMLWNWLPIIESGADAVLEWGLASTADRFFLRLRRFETDAQDPFERDLDADNIPDWWELMLNLNPFDPADSSFTVGGYTTLSHFLAGNRSPDSYEAANLQVLSVLE